MPCYSPVQAWQPIDGGKVAFYERKNHRPIKLACGQCIGCRLERSRQWAVRCMHEAQMHSENCFVTLTYDDAHVPQRGSLDYGDWQAFMRRVRKEMGKVRFYMCGEYGDSNGRPHFHGCLFGLDFRDKVHFRKLPSGSAIYTSETLSRLWPHGYASVGDVTFESAAYIARYVCKKMTGQEGETHYKRVDAMTGEIYDLVPEFCRCSLKPGLGQTWYDNFHKEVFPHDRIVLRGKEMKPPQYYKRLLKRRDPFGSDAVDASRVERAAEFVDDCTEARLAVREKVTRARLSFKKRGL